MPGSSEPSQRGGFGTSLGVEGQLPYLCPGSEVPVCSLLKQALVSLGGEALASSGCQTCPLPRPARGSRLLRLERLSSSLRSPALLVSRLPQAASSTLRLRFALILPLRNPSYGNYSPSPCGPRGLSRIPALSQNISRGGISIDALDPAVQPLYPLW